MIKCVKCNREATYNSPTVYCDLHWQLRLNEDMPKTEEEKRFIIGELEYTWNKYGRPNDADEILKELDRVFSFNVSEQ